MAAIMEADVTAVCGPKGRHNAERRAVRHGHGVGSVTLGGRRIAVSDRGCARSTARLSCRWPPLSVLRHRGPRSDGVDRMLAGLSTRCYPVGLEPVGGRTEKVAAATSRSAVSRRFVAQAETTLAELLAADLSSLGLVALMVDGVHLD